MARSGIEWTQDSWNPVTGCTKISPGCANCYAERMAKRLKAMGQEKYANGFEVTTHEAVLVTPLTWKRPRLIFVNSMSDLFHERVAAAFVHKVFDVMRRADQHVFQVLTKRSRRMANLSRHLVWPHNAWAGVSVENEDYLWRLDDLRDTQGPKVRFVSFEPLIGPISDANLSDINWIIVGGESGPGARPVAEEWVLELKRQAHGAGIAFFFKQWGGVNRKEAGRELGGRTWDEMPQQTPAGLQLAVGTA